MCFFSLSGDHRYLRVLPNSFPTLLSSDLYGDDLARELREYERKNDWLRETLTKVYKEAQTGMRPGIQPELAALETVTFLAGLLRLWLMRSEEHTSELQSLMRISYAVFCLKKKNK